jgi:hypothetical protein
VDEDTNFDQAVDEVVEQAQNLDRWKQHIQQHLRDQGEDPDDVRIIISHKIGDEWTATEIQGYPTD